MRRSAVGPGLLGALAIALLMGEASAPSILLKDPFDAAGKVPQRRAQRGDWRIADGVAKVTQDDKLYKQFKDHGPIIFYDLEYTDATIQFEYRPEQCKSFVFTCNGADGHVFRFITSAAGTSLRAFPPGEELSVQLHRDPKLALPQDQWTKVSIQLRGPKVEVRIGDAQPIQVEHPSLARPKTNLSVGFAFGTFSVKNLLVTH